MPLPVAWFVRPVLPSLLPASRRSLVVVECFRVLAPEPLLPLHLLPVLLPHALLPRDGVSDVSGGIDDPEDGVRDVSRQVLGELFDEHKVTRLALRIRVMGKVRVLSREVLPIYKGCLA